MGRHISTHLITLHKHALPVFHITSTYRACPAVRRRADGVGIHYDACLEFRSVIARV